MDWMLDILLPRDITQVRIFQPEAVLQEHFHAGEVIFDQGDFGNKLYVVVNGEVEILAEDKTVVLGPGEVFGEIALVNDSQCLAACLPAACDSSAGRPRFGRRHYEDARSGPGRAE